MRSMYHKWIDSSTRILSPADVAKVRQLIRRYRVWYIGFSGLFLVTFAASLILFGVAFQQRRNLEPNGFQFKTILYSMTTCSLLAMLLCLATSHIQCRSLEVLKEFYVEKMEATIGGGAIDEAGLVNEGVDKDTKID